jgi:putative hydrolase of HD superfamily
VSAGGHDSPESRIGDVPSVGRAYVNTASPEAVATHQTAGMPLALAEVFQGLVAEYEAAVTIESQVAHDADKVETLLQAVEYQAQGHDTAPWRESSTAALRTSSAKELAQAISSADPHEWWSAFAASYRELRATSRGSRSS